MKSVVCAFSLLFHLIIIFLLLGCNDNFSRGNGVVIRDEENVREKIVADEIARVAAASNPIEKPVETKPAETKPVGENKPLEEKPIAGAKTAETKSPDKQPAEDKPAPAAKPEETNSTTGTNPVVAAPVPEGSRAVAVPVVTAEEAAKLNSEAKDHVLTEKEKREPFFGLYQDSKTDRISFEGTVRATSHLPDPETNDYDNCLYALFIEVDSIISGFSPDATIACEVIVNAPIMKNKTILQQNVFQPGDKIFCSCAEYDEMPQAIQEIQLSDDIQSFEHQAYYPFSMKKISAFRKDGNRNFAQREISILPIQTFPRDEHAVALRKERIRNEIERIEEELKKHGGSFKQWKEDYKPIAEKYKKLQDENWKGWINDCYFDTDGNENSYSTKKYIEGILPYKEYLERYNIDLIVLRIPNKGDFSARVLCSDEFEENPAWVEHYYECLKNDIEIVDPMPEMWKHRFDYPLFYYYYPREEHPVEGTGFIAAKVLADVLQRYTYEKASQEITLRETSFQEDQPRYYWPKGNDKFNPNDKIRFRQVVQGEKLIGAPCLDSGSPFLFVSNSFFGHPDKARGASIPGYAAYHLQAAPDWIYQSGAGNGLLRTLVSNRDPLNYRKAVILVGNLGLWRQAQPSFPPYLRDTVVRKLTLEKTITDFENELVIPDNELYSFITNEENQLEIRKRTQAGNNLSKTYSFELTIPSFPQKTNCMIKLNYIKNTYITFRIVDKETDNVLEPDYTLSAQMNHAELFVPLDTSSPFRKIVIYMTPAYPEDRFILKNIELWSY